MRVSISILLLMYCIVARASGEVEGTRDFPPTPATWLIVCFPDNVDNDPLSQNLRQGFAANPVLSQWMQRSASRTYTASHPDWQHRWAQLVEPRYPIVIYMEGGQVIYKRSAATADAVAGDVRRFAEMGQRFRPFRPFQPGPCPGPNCPRPDDYPDDYPDDQPCSPDRPNSPLRPISPPLIPDTVEPVAPVVQPPYVPPVVVPPQPPDTTAIDDLTKRVDSLEKKVESISVSVNSIDSSVKALSVSVTQFTENKLDAEALAIAIAKAIPKPEAPVVNIDTSAIVAELVKCNQLAVNFLDGEGNVAATSPVKDGQINIPPVSATWIRLDGKVEQQSRPLVDPLKFQTEPRQAKPEGDSNGRLDP